MNGDAPAVARRRRRIARQQREKTPEPIARSTVVKIKYSDDESSSTTDINNRSVTTPIRRTKTQSASASSGEGSRSTTTNNSNVAYRNKILQRRDRNMTVSVNRCHSLPRLAAPVINGVNHETSEHRNSGGVNVMALLKQAKRSLSIPRSRDKEEALKRYAEMPIEKAFYLNSPKGRTESKLESNLRRFEEERRRFEVEKERFEREKLRLEQMRFQRLVELERKRSLQRKDKDKLQKVYEAANAERKSRQHQQDERIQRFLARSRSKSREREMLMEINRRKFSQRSFDAAMPIDRDYESSTETTVSSRADDFDELETIEQKLEEIIENKTSTIIVNEINAPENLQNLKSTEQKQSLLSRIIFGKRQPVLPKSHTNGNVMKKHCPIIVDDGGPISIKRILFIEGPIVWRQILDDHPNEWEQNKILRNRCIADFVALIMLLGAGGIIFRFVEGAFENFYKCGVKRVKRDFIDHLWATSHDMREEDWKSMTRSKLRQFEEELHVAHEAGMTSYSGMKAWTFINSVIYCMTIVTTIGYGHISPATDIGRAITIIYAVIGIPIFLTLLADFGKLLTRNIKFLWAYVRRLYYTGSLRRVRKQAQVQEMLRGMNIAYEIATFRRPSMMMKPNDLEPAKTETPNSSHLAPPSSVETPTTPLPPEIEIDDEFNLPVSLAFIILLVYILFGASIYSMWEKWSFFESFYFVFISMSTIGFGDYVPNHPMRMMASIIYLIFGLALTSMCINVVQLKLSDSFRQASAKIGATIGLTLAEEEARSSQNLTPVPENISVHSQGTFKFSPNGNSNGNGNDGAYDNAEIRDGKIITSGIKK